MIAIPLWKVFRFMYGGAAGYPKLAESRDLASANASPIKLARNGSNLQRPM